MNKPKTVIIDFEFTGLDNTFIADNEIIQMKAACIETDNSASHNFGAKKRLSAHVQLSHRHKKQSGRRFSKKEFEKLLRKIGVRPQDKRVFFGFGVTQDALMLRKYDIQITPIDIREMLQLSKHEYRLATEGSGLECAYLIATGDHPNLLSHDGVEEIRLIAILHREAVRLRRKRYLTVMPHGHCAGMPLEQYVSAYRRQADGYRYNNHDVLAESLTQAIYSTEIQPVDFEDDDN